MVGELVWYARRGDDDVAWAGVDAILTELERDISFLYDPCFVVGVAVRPGALPGFAVVKDQRDCRRVRRAFEA